MIGIVAVINVINLIDGVDGLAAGVCVISGVALAVIALSLERNAAGVLAALTAGASLGFLRHGFPPAKTFMGDTGSNLLGFLLGVVAVQGALKTNAVIALFLPLIILTVPILDTGFVVAKRLKYGRPIYRADRWHFHHRMANIGFSQRRTLAYLYGWTFVMAALALALRFVPYSDDHGHFNAFWTAVMAAFGLLALAASVYLVEVLEILKLRRMRLRQLVSVRRDAGSRCRRPSRSTSPLRASWRPAASPRSTRRRASSRRSSRPLSGSVRLCARLLQPARTGSTKRIDGPFGYSRSSARSLERRAVVMSPPKHVDLLVLAAALAVFVLGGLPLLGYAVAAAAWLAQRGIQVLAGRRAAAELAAGNRQRAMGIVAATTLGRVWLMVTAVLLGGLAEREAGLAAAVLLLVLFTISFAAQGIAHLLEPGGTGGMKTKTKVLIGIGAYFAVAILMLLIFGSSGKDESFQPQNEFKLEPWISIHLAGIDLSINKAVLYLVLASALTIFVMVWISRRMAQKPNRVQTAIEVAYDMTKNTITGGNLEPKTAARWFPFLAALFFWIWFSNMLGFLPLPTNTEHTVNVFGLEIPSFAIYAATANLSIPLVLTLVVWLSYHFEGSAPRASSPTWRAGCRRGWRR